MTTAKYGKDIEGAKRFKLRYFPQAWESFIESETEKERRKTMQAEASDTEIELTPEDLDYAKQILSAREYESITDLIVDDHKESEYYKRGGILISSPRSLKILEISDKRSVELLSVT